MAMTTTMTLAEVIALSIGWIFAILAIIFHILIWKFTHAWTFLRAWFQKVPIVREIDGGMVKYIKGKSHDEGTIDLPGGKFMIKTHNSHVFDMKSKVPLYDKYSDYAFTLDVEYNAIIEELRNKGIKVANYDDYKNLIRLATDNAYKTKFLNDIEKEDIREQFLKRIAEVEKLVVNIKPYKSYKIQDLSNMFPNNINTVNNDHKVISLVDRNAKRQKINKDLIIYAAVACIIVAFALVLISKFVKDPSCPDVVCNCAKTGIEMAKNTGAAIANAAANNPDSASEAARNVLMP